MSNFSAETVAKITEKLKEASENSVKLYEAGKVSEYDLFWDVFQKKGSRSDYSNVFSEGGNDSGWYYGTTFRPKYPIKPTQATAMFAYSRLPYEAIAAVDFSTCQDFMQTFMYYMGAILPPLDMRVATRTNNMFGWSTKLEKIEELWVTGNTPYNNIFNSTSNLKEVRFKGKIAQSGLDFKGCPMLSKDSIESVFECLDNSVTGKSITFSKAAVDKAYETSEGANDGSDSTLWNDDRVDSYSNWTFVLA